MRLCCLLAVFSAFITSLAQQTPVSWSVKGNAIVFSRLFKLQTGVKPIGTWGFDNAALRFHVGRTCDFAKSLNLDFNSLHPCGYYLVKRGGDVLFAGKTSKGDTYASIDFLKRFTGYREFGGTFGRVIPKVEALNLPESFTYREEPDIPSYRLAWCVGSEPFSRCERLICMSTHAMDKMVLPEMYKDHPEYFPLVGGTRVAPGDPNRPWNPCMSNPDLPGLFRAYAKRFFEKEPDALGIPMGVNDGGGDCNCEGCRTIFEKHGNQYVEFYNMAARILSQEHPGKLLAFIGYSRRCGKAPANGYQMEPNILVEVTGNVNNYDDWKKAGVKNFGTYEYLYQLGSNRIAPACYPHEIARRLRAWRKDYGMKTFWEESFAASSVFDGGRQYVIDELLWNLDADVDELMDDYCRSLYGPAARAMRRFFDVAEEAFLDNPERRTFFTEFSNPIQFNGYTFARIAAMDEALAEAARVAPRDSRESRRIELVTRTWGLARLFADNWTCARKLKTECDPAKVIALIERGMRDIEAIADYEMSADDEREVFVSGRPGAFASWKNQSALAPLPPLEAAADAALERIERQLGRDAARKLFAPLVDSPYVGPYAATRLYLMDNIPVNVAVNGDFESRWNEKPAPNAEPDWLPLGQRGWNWWRFPSSQARIWTDDTQSHSGKCCVAMSESQIDSCLLTQWRTDVNSRYRLSFWAKRTDDNSGGGLGFVNIRLKNGKGGWIDDGSAIRCEITKEAIGKWAQFSIIFTTPDRDDGVWVHPMFCPPRGQRPTSTLWIDDVTLEKVCSIPRRRVSQSDYAEKTLKSWLRNWVVDWPELVLDDSLPEGAFEAERRASRSPLIRGGEEGLRIGLYAWAQAQGVRWYSPAESPIVPPVPEKIAESFWGRHDPSFPFRGLHTCGGKGHYDPVVAHWMSFNGMNRRLDTLQEAVSRHDEYAKYGLRSDTCVHSFDTIIPEKKYFKDHPEYFALVGGRRLATGGQRCLSNVGFRQAFSEELEAWMAKVPDAASYGICPNDGYGWCECDDCRAMDTDEDRKAGTVNGRMAAFVKEMCARFPDKTIANYSYSNFRDFYKLYDKVPGNLLLSTTISHCQGHPLPAGDCPSNGKVWRRLKELADGKVDFYVYDYYTYLWEGLPAPMWQTVAADMKALHQMGCRGFLSEVNARGHDSWDGFAPALYVATRLLYDVTKTADELVEDWCRVRYGAAAREMVDYFRAWEKGIPLTRCFNKRPEEFAQVFQPQAEAFLAEAEKRAPDNVFVVKSRRLFDAWKKNLEQRKRWPVVRQVKLEDRLSKVALHFVRNSTQLADEKNPTETEMSLTDGHLHIRLTMKESKMWNLKRVKGDLTAGDSVELFFNDGMDGKTCYHFIVDTTGAMQACKCVGTKWNWNWKHDAKAVVKRFSNRWIVDFDLPLSDIGAVDEFAFSLVRNRFAGGSWETLGVPAGGAFFEPANYIRATK